MTAEDLVVVSLEDWDDVWRRNQFLIDGLLRTRPELRVLFIEPAADPLHALSGRHLPRPGRGLRPVEDLPGVGPDRLWRLQPTKWLPRSIGGDVDGRLAASARKAAASLGFERPILWVNDPVGSVLMAMTGWSAMYDITDDWLTANRSERQLSALQLHEDRLMTGCKEVVVCSPGLVTRKSPIRAVTLIRNAVDLARFRGPTNRPNDLPDRPVVLYVGTVHRDRFDIDLCVELAHRLGGIGTLTIVGPAPLPDHDRARLLGAGVVMLGSRHHASIPAYLQHADVLVVPHLVDEFTDSLDPIKLYEYRAAGRPVVSTQVAGFRESQSPMFTISSGQNFVDAVLSALATGPGAATAGNDDIPTWSDRVAEMQQVLQRVRAG